MIFADVRGSTAIAEQSGPSEFAGLLNRFYAVAMAVLIPRKAVIDKMIGDEVMAFFVPAFQPEQQKTAMDAASAILRGVGYGAGPDNEPWLPVGIGINFGEAYVGKVGTSEMNDFTVLVDPLSKTGANLVDRGMPGESAPFSMRGASMKTSGLGAFHCLYSCRVYGETPSTGPGSWAMPTR